MIIPLVSSVHKHFTSVSVSVGAVKQVKKTHLMDSTGGSDAAVHFMS